MKQFFFVIFSFIIFTRATSQSVEDSVKSVVNKMVAAMKSADKTTLTDCFADSAILQTVVQTK